MITKNYEGVRIRIVGKKNGKTIKDTIYAKKTQAAFDIKESSATEWKLYVYYTSKKTKKRTGENSASAKDSKGIIYWLNAFTEPDLIKYLCDY